LGWMPRLEEFDLEGMPDGAAQRLEAAQRIVLSEWRRELDLQDHFFTKLKGDVPKELLLQRELLASRLSMMSQGMPEGDRAV